MSSAATPLLNNHAPIKIKVQSFDALTIYRPDDKTVQATSDVAKRIFLEAFTTTYTEYYRKSNSTGPIETWLKLKDGLSLEQWLNDIFDNEINEYKIGKIGFIHLIDSKQNLVGWISHRNVSSEGDLYLSQCSLQAEWRGKKVASSVFSQIIKDNQINKIFQGVKAVKLIARRVNDAAMHLYTGSGFIKDESIDPKVYGDSYNDRYVGYRLLVAQ